MNIDGEIVGVNIMKRLAADGLGFAVPIDAVSKIMEQFKRNGYKFFFPHLVLSFFLSRQIVNQSVVLVFTIHISAECGVW